MDRLQFLGALICLNPNRNTSGYDWIF